jgi:hypothetical protein
MTTINVTVKKPENILTSEIRQAVCNVPFWIEAGIVPAGDTVTVSLKAKRKDLAWDAYHFVRQNYTGSFLHVVEVGNKNTAKIYK